MTMELRLATAADVDIVQELGKELFEYSIYSKVSTFDESYVRTVFLNSLEEDLDDFCTILLSKGSDTIGMLCATKNPAFTNKKEIMAIEAAFWIKPAYRTLAALKRLASAYRYWAVQAGCDFICYGAIKNKGSSETLKLRSLSRNAQ
jgi:hypothetical protein